MKKFLLLILVIGLTGCTTMSATITHEPQLLRNNYVSTVDGADREYFVYLPKNYQSSDGKKWPVMLFLHGNGERGNGKDELDYVLKHGPVYEAWIQKKDLPFIIISPQLHMFDFDKVSYIANRTRNEIPNRLDKGKPERPSDFATPQNITRVPSENDMTNVAPLLPKGWEQAEQDLIQILDTVLKNYNTDSKRVYGTGLSYGGFGTWYMASKHTQRFAAIAPVVGWGHPSLMEPIAKQRLPVWQFAGGRDSAVQIPYFYAGLNQLEQLGHSDVRFTVHEDMGHDAWTRVYSSDDLYQWLLSHSLHEQ